MATNSDDYGYPPSLEEATSSFQTSRAALIEALDETHQNRKELLDALQEEYQVGTPVYLNGSYLEASFDETGLAFDMDASPSSVGPSKRRYTQSPRTVSCEVLYCILTSGDGEVENFPKARFFLLRTDSRHPSVIATDVRLHNLGVDYDNIEDRPASLPSSMRETWLWKTPVQDIPIPPSS